MATTIFEKITRVNYDAMMNLLKQGEISYVIPSANINQMVIISDNNRHIFNLQLGDKVLRWTDYNLNRQPIGPPKKKLYSVKYNINPKVIRKLRFNFKPAP